MSRASRTFRIIGTVIKLLLTAGIAFVCGLLIWRIFISQALPDSMEPLAVNDALYEAYEEKGKELTLLTQGQGSITRADRNRGYFSVKNTVLIPDANQVQFVFRYNRSTVEALQKDYSLPTLPDGTEHLYDLSLLVAIDLTPEDKTDNDKSNAESVKLVRVHPTALTSAEKSLYHYRRAVFDLGEAELELGELMDSGLLLAIYADVYYVGDTDYTKTPYGTLCLYDYAGKIKRIKLTSADRDALAAYQKQN